MRIYECEQNTDEWLAAKLGVPSASNFDRIITSTGTLSKQRKMYLYELAGEIITGKRKDSFQNADMRRGVELEPEAKLYYNSFIASQGEESLNVGFCLNENPKYGCSPDGLIGDDGMIEIKCPSLPVHISYLFNDKLPTEYYVQVQGQLLVTGRKYNKFLSYHPGIQHLLITTMRDEEFIAKLEKELEKFCEELEKIINKIKEDK